MKRQLMIAVGVAVLAAATFLWMMKSPAREAATFLHYLDNVIPGKTTEAELLSNPGFNAVERQCEQSLCSYNFVAENKLLKSLRLAPDTMVSSMVVVENGLVSEIWISATVFGKSEALMVTVLEIPSNDDCSAKPCVRRLERHGKNVGSYQSATITFDGDSYLHKQIADTMNLKCLSRLRGCANQVEMAPFMAHASEFVPDANWIRRKIVRPAIMR